MSLYNVDGDVLSSVYSKSGGSLSSAYDIDGLQIFPDELIVMTYNVQWFSGINSQQSMQESIINQHKPMIIGLQEVTTSGSISSVGLAALSDYSIRLSNHKNYIGMASKLSLSNVTINDFVHQDPLDISQWNETRAYMSADINFFGKTIKWINTHLCIKTQSSKFEQMEEIFNMAEQEEYVIITGDFNCLSAQIGDTEYNGMFKQFVDAGYNLADCTPQKGVTKTATSRAYPVNIEDLDYPCDNIITSSNINIDSVTYDLTKFSYLNGSAFDHLPVIVKLSINNE